MRNAGIKIMTAIALCLLVLAGTNSYLSAQPQKGKANKQNGKKEITVPGDQDKVKENQGNAYGKNKGDLSGKEFGQARAEAAKLNKEKTLADKKKELKNAQKKMKKDKKKKKITEEEFQARKRILDNEQKELEEQ